MLFNDNTIAQATINHGIFLAIHPRIHLQPHTHHTTLQPPPHPTQKKTTQEVQDQTKNGL